MKFKLRNDRPKHTDLVACLGWSNSNELLSVGEDNAVHKWDINGDPVSNY